MIILRRRLVIWIYNAEFFLLASRSDSYRDGEGLEPGFSAGGIACCVAHFGVYIVIEQYANRLCFFCKVFIVKDNK